jgi:hypothetical protein
MKNVTWHRARFLQTRKRDRIALTSFVLAALVASFATPTRVIAGRSASRAMDTLCVDSTAATRVDLEFFRKLAISTDSGDVSLRNVISLPIASARDVSFVRDTTLCRRAAQGIRHVLVGADTGALIPVELYRYGSTRYLGNWPRMLGEFGATVVFDTTFAIIGSVTR